MNRFRLGCLTVVVGLPLLFIAWYTELILPPPIICSMADQEACPDVSYHDVEWRDEAGPRVLWMEFADPDPTWDIAGRVQRMEAAEWVAVAEIWLDPQLAVVCNPGQRTRLVCDPVGEIDN